MHFPFLGLGYFHLPSTSHARRLLVYFTRSHNLHDQTEDFSIYSLSTYNSSGMKIKYSHRKQN